MHADHTDRWNEEQEADMKLNFACSRDNPQSAIGSRQRDIVHILDEGNNRIRYPEWWEVCKRASDEIKSLRWLHQRRANSELHAMELVRDLVLMLDAIPHDHSNYGCSRCDMIASANQYLASAAHRRVRSLEHAGKLEQETDHAS